MSTGGKTPYEQMLERLYFHMDKVREREKNGSLVGVVIIYVHRDKSSPFAITDIHASTPNTPFGSVEELEAMHFISEGLITVATELELAVKKNLDAGTQCPCPKCTANKTAPEKKAN